jgi:tetratricopeptide (TPR) repeat protein
MAGKKINPLTGFFKFLWWHFVADPVSQIKEKKNIGSLARDGNSPMYRTLFFWLSVLLFIVMPLLSLQFGRNSDETVSNNYGKDILNYITTLGNDRSVFDENKTGYKHMFYYGLSFDLLCAAANKISPFGEFETRHMLNSLFGWLAIFFAALIARRLLHWRAAVLVLIFMFISPQFLGYSMNNAKDIPFAAGYAAGVYFIIRFLSQLPSPPIRTFVFLSLSIGFTCTNKVNGIILLAYLALFLFIIALNGIIKTRNIRNHIPLIKRYFYYFILTGLISYLLTIAFWPFAHQGIVKNVWQAFRQFEKIGNLMIHYELFDGERINMEFVPWYYTFKLMLITIPLYIIAGFAASLAGIRRVSKKTNIYLFGILLFVSFFPILYAMYKHSKLYNGWRHFLFVYPTLVVMAVAGWEFLLSIFSKKYLRYLLIIILAFMMAKPLYWMAKNHPHEVTYFNELAGGVNGAYSYYETDPLTNCSRQAIEWLVKNVDVNSTPVIVGSNVELESLRYYADRYPNKIRYVWLRDYNRGEFNWEYAILVTRGMSHSQLTTGGFPPKGTIHMIKSDDIPLCVIVKRPNTLKYEAFRHYEKEEFEKAIPWFQKAIAFDSLDEEALTTLGSCYINTGDYAKGVAYSVKGINLHNENYIAYNNLGVAEFFNKRYDKAIENYRKSLYYRINWKSTILNLAKTYFFLERYDSAMWYFNLGNSYYPNDPEILQNIGELYKAMGEKDLALQVFEKLNSISPQDPNARRNVEWLQKSISNQSLNEDIERAKYFSSQNLHDSAIACLNNLLAKDSANIDGLLNRGVAYYFTRQFDKALADFDHALKLDPNQSDAWLKKAQLYNVTGKKGQVLPYLNKALQINPKNAEALNERGHYYFSVKEWEKAFRDYSESLNLYPNQPSILYSRAYTFSMQKRYDEAFPDVNKALKLDPNFGDAYMFKAMLYYETGRYTESLSEVEKAKKTGHKVDQQFEANLRKEIDRRRK